MLGTRLDGPLASGWSLEIHRVRQSNHSFMILPQRLNQSRFELGIELPGDGNQIASIDKAESGGADFAF